MVRLTALFSIFPLFVLISASEVAFKDAKGGFSRTVGTGVSRRSLHTDMLSKRCSGTCAECFGSGYTSCPDSDEYCYLPGDSTYGIDSCPGYGSSTTTAAAPVESTQTCYGVDATCVSCFGSGYINCPGSTKYCYLPGDPTSGIDTCPDSGFSGTTTAAPATTSSGSSGGSSCADQYGAGSVDCGPDACYNPTQGEVCCAGGYHCESGSTCSSQEGYCCAADSTSSDCTGSGSGSGSGSGVTTAFSSYGFSSYSSFSFSSEIASTSDIFHTTTSQAGPFFGESSTTASQSAGSGSSNSGLSQNSNNGAPESNTVGLKLMAIVLGMISCGMMLL